MSGARTIKVADGTKKAFPTIRETVERSSFALADELICYGQTPSEAGSIVANVLLQAAWLVAATARIADGETPNSDNFREAAERALAFYDFSEAIANIKKGGAR